MIIPHDPFFSVSTDKNVWDQYQKLGRSLQNFRFLQKIEIGKSSRIIEVVFAGIFGRAL